MSIAEFLMVVSAWCGMSTYSRANAATVNFCRQEFFDCMKTNDRFKEKTVLSSVVVECSQKVKLKD